MTRLLSSPRSPPAPPCAHSPVAPRNLLVHTLFTPPPSIQPTPKDHLHALVASCQLLRFQSGVARFNVAGGKKHHYVVCSSFITPRLPGCLALLFPFPPSSTCLFSPTLASHLFFVAFIAVDSSCFEAINRIARLHLSCYQSKSVR